MKAQDSTGESTTFTPHEFPPLLSVSIQSVQDVSTKVVEKVKESAPLLSQGIKTINSAPPIRSSIVIVVIHYVEY